LISLFELLQRHPDVFVAEAIPTVLISVCDAILLMRSQDEQVNVIIFDILTFPTASQTLSPLVSAVMNCQFWSDIEFYLTPNTQESILEVITNLFEWYPESQRTFLCRAIIPRACQSLSDNGLQEVSARFVYNVGLHASFMPDELILFLSSLLECLSNTNPNPIRCGISSVVSSGVSRPRIGDCSLITTSSVAYVSHIFRIPMTSW
jgi:hypothetical protein